MLRWANQDSPGRHELRNAFAAALATMFPSGSNYEEEKLGSSVWKIPQDSSFAGADTTFQLTATRTKISGDTLFRIAEISNIFYKSGAYRFSLKDDSIYCYSLREALIYLQAYDGRMKEICGAEKVEGHETHNFPANLEAIQHSLEQEQQSWEHSRWLQPIIEMGDLIVSKQEVYMSLQDNGYDRHGSLHPTAMRESELADLIELLNEARQSIAQKTSEPPSLGAGPIDTKKLYDSLCLRR